MATIDGVTVLVPPPPGYVVDFDNPRRRSVPAAYIVSAVGMVLAAFMMGQRLYVKAVLRNKLTLEDLILVLAWLGTIAIQSLILCVHVWEIPIDKAQMFSLIEIYINSIVYTVPTTLAKLVILLFYREIDNPQAWYRWAVYFMMFVVAGSGTGIFFSSTFSCHPFAKNYDLTLTDVGSCIDRKAMYQATAGIGVATDVLIFAIPIPMVVSLRMSQARKIGLIIMFAVGSATVVTSMIRLALLVLSLNDLDMTWGGGPICLWICVEANLLIMCASLPTLNHFVKAVAPGLLTGTGDSSKRSSKTKSANHELRTFGAGNPKKLYYNRFDETEVATDTVVRIQGQPPKSRSQDGSRTSGDDNRSDEGIVQTMETHVYYEQQAS